MDGRKWRTTYSDPDNTERRAGQFRLAEAFERMKQFMQDTGLSQDDLPIMSSLKSLIFRAFL